MRLFLLLLLVMVALPGPADARCRCLCVDGARQAICSGPSEVPPQCPILDCPQAPLTSPPEVAPQEQAGLTGCRMRQVLIRGRYRWRQFCG